MNASLQELYQQVVLEHNRNPRNRRAIDGGRTAERYNRICGDRVTVYVRMEDAVIRDVSFQGSGCAILVASASLMTERVMGQTLTSVKTVVEQFDAMVGTPWGAPVDDLGELTALTGVRQFPIRVRCARLPWDALSAALALGAV